MTEKWWYAIDWLTQFHCYFHSYFDCTSVTFCRHMSSGDGIALSSLELSDKEKDALQGHRALVLTSSKALPDCALNCSSFFLNDTLFAVATLYATDEKFTLYSCQFCIDQILIQESPASAMSAFMILSCLLVHCHCSNVTCCCIVECCASLAQAIYLLGLLSKPRALEICQQLSEEEKGDVMSWSLTSAWRHVKRTGSQICLSLS